jgi:hypothetical protein
VSTLLASGWTVGAAVVAGIAAMIALAFVRTALWALALIAAGAAAAATVLEDGILPLVMLGGLAAGVATGFSPEWWRAEQVSAQRHRDVLPAAHREQLASASWWYPGRVAAAALTLTFPAAVVVVCLVVARWSLQHAG